MDNEILLVMKAKVVPIAIYKISDMHVKYVVVPVSATFVRISCVTPITMEPVSYNYRE
jgi:hypothetical protein